MKFNEHWGLSSPLVTLEEAEVMAGMPDNLGVLPKLALLRTAQYKLSANLPQSRAEWILFHMANGGLVGFAQRLLTEAAGWPDVVRKEMRG